MIIFYFSVCFDGFYEINQTVNIIEKKFNLEKQLETKIADYYKTKDEARLKNIRDQLKIFKKTRRNSRNKMRKTMRRNYFYKYLNQ
jgi:hypothetical protein